MAALAVRREEEFSDPIFQITRRRHPQIAGPATPDETPHCLLRCVYIRQPCAPTSLPGNPSPTSSAKIPKSAGEMLLRFFRWQKETECPDRKRETTFAARILRAPANSILPSTSRATAVRP